LGYGKKKEAGFPIFWCGGGAHGVHKKRGGKFQIRIRLHGHQHGTNEGRKEKMAMSWKRGSKSKKKGPVI